MTLRIGNTRVAVHPLALLFPLIALRLGSKGELTALLLSLSVHEIAHLAVARAVNARVSELRLMPFGGAIVMENPYALSPPRLIAVALAGPLGNGLLIVLCAALAHWGALDPVRAMRMLRVNLLLALFNLLPALPLDGGRILYGLLFPGFGRERAAKAGIAAGAILGILLILLAVVAAVTRRALNLSPVLCGIFLLTAAPREQEALLDTRVQTLVSRLRPMGRPVPVRLYAISSHCEPGAALRAARPDSVTLYAVYDGDRLVSFTDDRTMLNRLLSAESNP